MFPYSVIESLNMTSWKGTMRIMEFISWLHTGLYKIQTIVLRIVQMLPGLQQLIGVITAMGSLFRKKNLFLIPNLTFPDTVLCHSLISHHYHQRAELTAASLPLLWAEQSEGPQQLLICLHL